MQKKFIITIAILMFLNANAQEISQQDVQRFSAYYSNGMQNLKNQQYSSAIVDFKKVLRFSPYDTTVQEALVNSYLARAQYYRQTTKEIKKAIVDYKSAYFYARNWSKSELTSSMAQAANISLKAISELEKRLDLAQTSQNRLQNAKILKAQGELAAAGYDFQQLKSSQYSEIAYENLANIYKNLNNLAYAMDYIKTAIDINPKNPKLHFQYGVMLDEAKNYEASMEQYNLALQYGDKSPELMEVLENKWTQNIVNNPNDAQSYINLGAIYQKQGNLDSAKMQYLKAIQMDNNDDTASYNLASLYIQQKNYNSAIDVYNKLLIKKPNDIELLQYKAQALYDSQKYDEALKQCDLILNLNSNNQIAKQMSDDIVSNRFQGPKLLNYLMTKANANPNNYEAQFNYALELHKNKNYPIALQYYQRALNVNPSKEETYINMAQIYIEQKNYSKAQEICQKGLMILPQNQTLNQYIADIKNYSMGSIYDEATKLYEAHQYESALNKYKQIQNKNTQVNLAIASCYWQLNDYKNANKYYLEVLKQEPNNKDALVNSAYAYFSMNDYNSAKLTAQKLLSIDKTNKEAQEIISNIEQNQIDEIMQNMITKYEKNDFKGAITFADKLLSQKPNDEYALYYKALSYDELKNIQEAIKQYKLLISKHPNFTNAYYSLAVDLDNQENYKEAVSNYEKFINLSNQNKEQNDMTKFAQNRVKELKDYLTQINEK